jgi:LPXTG-site transpeptidase (sortase) family protein
VTDHLLPTAPRVLVLAVLAILAASCADDRPEGHDADDRAAATSTSLAPSPGDPGSVVAATKTWTDDDPTLISEHHLAEPAAPDPAQAWLYEFPPEERGTVVGRIVIPKAGTDADVVFGVNQTELAVGPGLMPRTAVPGQWGNSVVAAHRTTYGAWFHDIDLLEPGDEILIETGLGTHTYAVVSTEIVLPTAMWVAQHREGAWLTLVACHPKGSAAQRIIVFANLIDGPNIDAATAAFAGPYLPPQDPGIGAIPSRHHPQPEPVKRRM